MTKYQELHNKIENFVAQLQKEQDDMNKFKLESLIDPDEMGKTEYKVKTDRIIWNRECANSMFNDFIPRVENLIKGFEDEK